MEDSKKYTNIQVRHTVDVFVAGGGPAGIAAAMASDAYQDRNIRSTKCCTDQVAVLNINGTAMPNTSR